MFKIYKSTHSRHEIVRRMEVVIIIALALGLLIGFSAGLFLSK